MPCAGLGNRLRDWLSHRTFVRIGRLRPLGSLPAVAPKSGVGVNFPRCASENFPRDEAFTAQGGGAYSG